jgi:general secretion pathway protein G
MKNRKKGFSLVELLIVLAVIAALIATITPVALNAIQKAQATKVGQNLKTLASAFENYVYVSGSAPARLDDIGRDIDSKMYTVYYAYSETSGDYTVTVLTSEQANEDILTGLVSNAVKDDDLPGSAFTELTSTPGFTGTPTYQYTFKFTNY